MGASEESQSGPLAAIQVAIEKIAQKAVSQAVSQVPQDDSPKESSSEEIKKTVTDAVTNLLLETDLMERLIDRHFKKNPQPASDRSGADTPAGEGKDLQESIQEELKAFLTSNEFKELMDDKFRTITLYLKTEVIPRVVQKELSNSSA